MSSAFLQDDDGATTIEYGLIAGLVTVAILGALSLLDTELSDLFSGIAGEVEEASSTLE